MSETLEERKQFNLSRAKTAREIVASGGLVLHAAACEKDGFAYVFFGPSGAGKSTAMDHSPRTRKLSEEAVALERNGSVWYARGLPYAGDARFDEKTDAAFPVKGLYRLHHAENNSAVRISPATAAAALLTFPASDGASDPVPAVFDAAVRIAAEVACYELYLRNDESFWEVL
jgi:hypothetical protein